MENLDIDQEQKAYEYGKGFDHVGKTSFDVILAKDSTIPTMQSNIDLLLQGVENGEVNGLEVFAVFKKLEKIFDEAKKKAEKYAFDEAEKVNEKTFTNFGCQFTIKQGYAQYNYEEDHVYSDLKEKLKNREELLKLALKSKDIIFGSDGVEVPKVSVKGYTKDSLSIKF